MNEPFSRKHNQGAYENVAPFYDLHAPKNVDDMLSFWEFVVRQHARRPVRDVLEFACGTGRLALPLAQKGYCMTGTDASQPMLDVCRQRAESLGVEIQLRRELMEDFGEQEGYDALVAIFGAIAFLVEDEPIRQFLTACDSALRPGGFFLVDVPNGLEGLVRPWAGVSAETFEGEGMVLQRFLQQIPDTFQATTRYRDTGFVRTAEGVRCYQEEYLLRIFSWPQLRLLLEQVGFSRMTCYCNWRDREPMREPYSRLILVLEK